MLVVLPIFIWLPTQFKVDQIEPNEASRLKDIFAFVYGVLLTQCKSSSPCFLLFNLLNQFLYQDAEEGIYKAIGDGLRRYPEHLTPDPGATAV